MTARKRLLVGTTASLALAFAIGALTADALIAARTMNPVPTAISAITRAGWEGDQIVLRSYSGSGRLLESVATVQFGNPEDANSGRLSVELRRPFLTGRWEITKLERAGRD